MTRSVRGVLGSMFRGSTSTTVQRNRDERQCTYKGIEGRAVRNSKDYLFRSSDSTIFALVPASEVGTTLRLS